MEFLADLFAAKHYYSFLSFYSNFMFFKLAGKYKVIFCHPNQCLFFLIFSQTLLTLKFHS